MIGRKIPALHETSRRSRAIRPIAVFARARYEVPAMPLSYLVLLMLHFIGLAVGVGASFALFTLRRVGAALPESERSAFMLRALAVAKNGSYGLLLLLVTGLGMFFMRGPAAVMAAGGPAFHAKLTLVVILCGVVGYSQALGKRARGPGGTAALSKLPAVGNAILLLGIGIVIAAVLAFQ